MERKQHVKQCSIALDQLLKHYDREKSLEPQDIEEEEPLSVQFGLKWKQWSWPEGDSGSRETAIFEPKNISIGGIAIRSFHFKIDVDSDCLFFKMFVDTSAVTSIREFSMQFAIAEAACVVPCEWVGSGYHDWSDVEDLKTEALESMSEFEMNRDGVTGRCSGWCKLDWSRTDGIFEKDDVFYNFFDVFGGGGCPDWGRLEINVIMQCK